ncbi:hypothetical protein DFH09DRAFT_1194051 [Mycena vulgaris]|nr:hypothetical protein DFH09DRAFT_1194051 [Mycena vulgaris]
MPFVSKNMLLSAIFVAVAAVAPALAAVPSLKVPACPAKGTVTYNKSVPDKAAFPLTQVDVCYDATAIHITFTAHNETNFFVNPNFTTNQPIYEYTAMETFIARATADPQTYLEFEIAPNNVTFQAFIYNPSKVRADGAPFDTFFVAEPLVDGLTAAKGTQWRMNFFRIITAPSTFPAQFLGAWNQPNEANFHMTPFFGNVAFV